jgi:hypothetical protein
VVALASGSSTNQHSPDEHLESEVLGDGEFLESIRVGKLGDKIADVEEGAKVVKLVTVQVRIFQKPKDRGGSDGVLIEELD